MKIKKQYELKDTAWIHLGNGKLHKGRVVDYFDLEHVGYPKSTEFYIVEIPTEIDPLLEVRTWEQMSQDSNGPIGAYRAIKEEYATGKFLGKIGIEVPFVAPAPTIKIDVDPLESDEYDPTPEEIHAAMERAEKAHLDAFTLQPKAQPKKRNFPPRGRKPKTPRPL